jgi:hypothetical protein
MKPLMKMNLGLVLAGSFSLAGNSQILFTAADLPSQPGQYSRAYISTNVDVSSLLGAPGGPQRWDFSQPQQPGETIRRMDVTAPSDGGHGSSFPNATYSERYTDEPSGAPYWDYYSITASPGRRYFGFYNAAPPLPGAVIFQASVVDIPGSISFGTNWSYTWDAYLGIEEVYLTATATVDGYGTMVLPQIGEVSALRVNQLNCEQILFSGFPFGTSYFREYYWLAPGIGKAVHVISVSGDSPPALDLTTAQEVRRVFEAGGITKPPAFGPVVGLRLRQQNTLAVLNWFLQTNASGYRVEALGNVADTNWQLLSQPATNSWSEALTTTQRFYRVWWKP